MILAACLLGSCASPCEKLAEVACETAGESSEECRALREGAKRASAEDKRACEVALELVESLEKVR